jgi:hypothetical protein
VTDLAVYYGVQWFLGGSDCGGSRVLSKIRVEFHQIKPLHVSANYDHHRKSTKTYFIIKNIVAFDEI